jgi:hypothetical protein
VNRETGGWWRGCVRHYSQPPSILLNLLVICIAKSFVRRSSSSSEILCNVVFHGLSVSLKDCDSRNLAHEPWGWRVGNFPSRVILHVYMTLLSVSNTSVRT